MSESWRKGLRGGWAMMRLGDLQSRNLGLRRIMKGRKNIESS